MLYSIYAMPSSGVGLSPRRQARASRRERIEYVDACPREVGPVPSHDDESVLKRGSGDEAVLDRHRLSLGLQARYQFRPTQARLGLPGDAE